MSNKETGQKITTESLTGQIVLFEQFHGRTGIGSSRIRGHFLIKYWNELQSYKIGADSDFIIYQKCYWFQHAELYKGIKILDLCDPDFLHFGYPVKRMTEAVDAVTCSTEALACAVDKFTDKPVFIIPDRFDLEHITFIKKEHAEQIESVAWFGYPQNYPLLDSCVSSLMRHKIKKLIVVSDRKKPYILPAGLHGIEVVNLPFTDETYLSDIGRADIVLNPKSDSSHWKYKSNNKTTLARLCGIPVAHTEDELIALRTKLAREIEADKQMKICREDYNIKISIKEFKKILSDL